MLRETKGIEKKGFYNDDFFFAFRLNVVMLALFIPFQSQAQEIKPFKRKLVLDEKMSTKYNHNMEQVNEPNVDCM